MTRTELLIERLKLQGALYAAVRCTHDALTSIAAKPESHPSKAPRFAYRMTLHSRVSRA